VHKDTQNGNTPPIIEVGSAPITATVGQPITLSVGVIDDGLPKPPRNRPNTKVGLGVVWSMYRGPGHVTFRNDTSTIKDGKAVTTATFSEAGVYSVQALADDGSVFLTSQGQHVPGFACCWTTAHLTVTVK
jgi:hypothetical protein